MAYVLAGASLSRLVLVTDCPNTHAEELTEAYAAKTEAEIPEGLRWFYCAGLGVALLCMSIISLSHVHKEFDGQRIEKRYRIAIRIAVSITLICLPLARSLNSLQLISITTGLVAFVLMVDVYGSTSKYDNFWACTSHCKYRANCPLKKRILAEAVKSGTTVKLEEVQLEHGEKPLYEV